MLPLMVTSFTVSQMMGSGRRDVMAHGMRGMSTGSQQSGDVPAPKIILPDGQIAGQSSGRPFLQTNTFASNGMRAWSDDLPDARIWEFPPYYLRGMQITTGSKYSLVEDAIVQYECPAGRVTPCDVVVFLHECYPCPTERGDLPAALMSDGFQRSRCAQSFTVRENGFTQKMTAFIKTIDAGEVIDIKMPGQVDFAAFGMSNGDGVDCSEANELRCKNSMGHCLWNPVLKTCKLATCIQMGPSKGGCDLKTCVKDEIAALFSGTP